MDVKVYENMIWNILDDDSKVFIISILKDQGFQEECKLIAKVSEESTVLEITDSFGHVLVLPINILDILNE